MEKEKRNPTKFNGDYIHVYMILGKSYTFRKRVRRWREPNMSNPRTSQFRNGVS
jgi:hypothetical protein